jgi:hypothetical protein
MHEQFTVHSRTYIQQIQNVRSKENNTVMKKKSCCEAFSSGQEIPALLGAEDQLLCSKEPCSGPYLQPVESSQNFKPHIFKINFNFVILSVYVSQVTGFQSKIWCTFSSALA